MKLLKYFAAPGGALILLASLSTALVIPERSNLNVSMMGVGLVLVFLGVLLNGRVILVRL